MVNVQLYKYMKHNNKHYINVLLFAALIVVGTKTPVIAQESTNALVLQTDFGVKDGAVTAMKGVAFSVDKTLAIYDLTHEIPAFDIWAASYRLVQTLDYWPQGTVFVNVVDPGVGTDRKSVVAKTEDGKYIVTPDNGTLTLIADTVGIVELREIDEKINRLKNSYDSYTFHGRDVYSYTGARLAASVISFEQVGPKLPNTPRRISYQKAQITKDTLRGTIPILDVQYGNVWTNIDKALIETFGMEKNASYEVSIYNEKKLVYQESVPYVNSFGDVAKSAPLLYLNSLLNLSIALNWDNFAAQHKVSSGPTWSITIKKK